MQILPVYLLEGTVFWQQKVCPNVLVGQGYPWLRIPLCWQLKPPPVSLSSRNWAAQGENCFGKLKRSLRKGPGESCELTVPPGLGSGKGLPRHRPNQAMRYGPDRYREPVRISIRQRGSKTKICLAFYELKNQPLVTKTDLCVAELNMKYTNSWIDRCICTHPQRKTVMKSSACMQQLCKSIGKRGGKLRKNLISPIFSQKSPASSSS